MEFIYRGIFTLMWATGNGQQGKLIETYFGQPCKSKIYQTFLFLSTIWNLFTFMYNLAADTGLIGKPTTVEEMDRCR